MQIVGQTWLNHVTWICGSWNEGQHDLYFTVQWFCLISWRLFDVWTSLFGIMNQYDLTFDLKMNVGQYDLYFMVQWFCLISWRLFEVWTSLFGIMNQYDPTFDRKINVGQCDLYFMVHWFCLIFWRLFDVWTSLFGIMNQYDLMCGRKIKCRSLWPIFHGPLILHYILKTVWSMSILIWDYESVWPDVWPQNKCRSLWPIFHGPVILPYFQIMRKCDSNFDLKINIGQHDLYVMV